ncbi:MAG: chromosomal replication initiator protein DnaA, partial [Akkermansia sp.]|nr:chromosomal replication initiator protein DnaA [Akkermansia sp.]
ILSADCPASDITKLDDRLTSRFEQGLTVALNVPDLETRIAILRKKRRMWKSTLISDEVINYLAKNITRSVRRLEGALVRLATFASFSQKSPSIQDARVQLNDLLKEEKTTGDVTIADIQRRVAEEFNIRVADINGRRRTSNIAHPRQLAMFLARRHTQSSLQDIGAAFGGRDHGTVIHATKTIEEKMESTPAVRELVERLSASFAG